MLTELQKLGTRWRKADAETRKLMQDPLLSDTTAKINALPAGTHVLFDMAMYSVVYSSSSPHFSVFCTEPAGRTTQVSLTTTATGALELSVKQVGTTGTGFVEDVSLTKNGLDGLYMRHLVAPGDTEVLETIECGDKAVSTFMAALRLYFADIDVLQDATPLGAYSFLCNNHAAVMASMTVRAITHAFSRIPAGKRCPAVATCL